MLSPRIIHNHIDYELTLSMACDEIGHRLLAALMVLNSAHKHSKKQVLLESTTYKLYNMTHITENAPLPYISPELFNSYHYCCTSVG